MIKNKKIDFGVAADFKKTFCRECKPHFLGLWDTVSSVGWVYNVAHFPGTKATHNPDLQIVRHAISIDERRAFFRQNLFGAPHDIQQDIREVWFAGVHSDVGGSYVESESQLSKISLQWIVADAESAGLHIDQSRKADILGGKPPYVAPDPLTRNQHESLRGPWWIAELWPKIDHREIAPGVWKKYLRMNLGRRRWIAPDPVVHPSVEQRLADKDLGYVPSNLVLYLKKP
jgi:type VI secretion system (T6SS) phospholipase Tle1-like effector